MPETNTFKIILNRVSLLALFFCLFTSPALAAKPTLGSISPYYGSIAVNTPVTFTTSYSDTNGYAHLQTVRLLINKGLTSVSAVYAYYNQNTNKLYLYNDAGSSSLGGFAPGSANTIENSYGKLNCALTTVTASGNTITVKWNLTFKTAFISTQTKNLYLYAVDDANVNSGFSQKGNYLVGPNTTPAVGIITPISGSTAPNTALTFSTTYSDPNGYQDIQYVFLLANTSTSYANCLFGYYNQDTNKFYLRDDAGVNYRGGYAPGSANIIENSYAKLDCSKSTVSGSGTTLTVKWNLTFKNTFAGSKNTYLYVRDDSNLYQGWVKRGDYCTFGQPIAPQ